MRLKLRIVDSVGFGDQINKEDRWVYRKSPKFWTLKTFAVITLKVQQRDLSKEKLVSNVQIEWQTV